MSRKAEKLTPRQRQSQRIMREKASKKKRQAIAHKCLVAGSALLSVALVGSGVWMWKNGVAARALQATVDGAYSLTADAGFALRDVYLEGRSRTPMAEINAALAVKTGEPILQFSLEDARKRLEAIESVKLAAVERELPGTLFVRIVEREPVALWQHQGKMALVDDNGMVMHDIEMAPYARLPLIVGADAPANVGELMAILAAQPALAKQFAAAVRVGERRWNIRLESGVEIKLPEKDALAAWNKLADLQARQQLLDRNIKVIDLRLPERLFITVKPEDRPIKSSGAKDT
jgi:cell division protein FtsQ